MLLEDQLKKAYYIKNYEIKKINEDNLASQSSVEKRF